LKGILTRRNEEELGIEENRFLLRTFEVVLLEGEEGIQQEVGVGVAVDLEWGSGELEGNHRREMAIEGAGVRMTGIGGRIVGRAGVGVEVIERSDLQYKTLYEDGIMNAQRCHTGSRSGLCG